MRDDATFSSLHVPDPIDGVRFAGVNIPEAPTAPLARRGPTGVGRPSPIARPVLLAGCGRGAPPAARPLDDGRRRRGDRVRRGRFLLDIAEPVPAQATLLLLGLPVEDWDRYAAPADEVVFTRRGRRSSSVPLWAMPGCSRALPPDHRPAGGASRRHAGRMVTTEVDGRLLDDAELVSLCGTMINGGVARRRRYWPTWSTISTATTTSRRSYRRPWPTSCSDRGVPPVLLPVQSFSRTVTHDANRRPVTWHSDRVLMCSGSANRDRAEFEVPTALSSTGSERPRRVGVGEAPVHRVHTRTRGVHGDAVTDMERMRTTS